MRKFLLLLIKYIPVIQLAGMLFNNLLYFNDIYVLSYVFDYMLGNSMIISILLFACSIVFKFCPWHRIIILADIVNITISLADSVYMLPASDLQLLAVYYLISSVFIIIAVWNHLKYRNYDKETYDCERIALGLCEEYRCGK